MRSFDTNLLVRILTRDDVGQVAVIDRLLDALEASGEQFFVPITVILELDWVLRSVYRRTRADVVRALNALLENASLVVEHHEEVELALDSIVTGPRRADFADALHVAISWKSDHLPLLTFDEGCARLAGAELLA